MSRTTRRPLARAGLLAATALVLTGCSAVQGFVGGVEPERDEATGEIVEAAQADAFALRVGDCLDVSSTEESEVLDSVPTVPCGEPHEGEVYASHALADGDFPGDEAVAAQAEELCYSDFQAFVGLAYEDSTLDFSTMYPTADSWQLLDDREVLCVVVDPAAAVTGTLEGAGY